MESDQLSKDNQFPVSSKVPQCLNEDEASGEAIIMLIEDPSLPEEDSKNEELTLSRHLMIERDIRQFRPCISIARTYTDDSHSKQPGNPDPRYSTEANVLLAFFIFINAGALATITNMQPNIYPADSQVVTLTGIESLKAIRRGFYFILILTSIFVASKIMIMLITWSQLVQDSKAFYLKSIVFFVMAFTFILYALKVEQLAPHFHKDRGRLQDFKCFALISYLLWLYLCSLPK